RTRKRRTTQMSRARQSGRGQLPQAERVLRRIAPLVIVEVGEDVARLRAPSFDPLRPLAERVVFVVRGIAAAGAVKAQVDEVCRHCQMRRPVRRLPCDERDVPPTKEGERLRREPGAIAGLERVTSSARRDHPKESLRALVIELHPRRQLNEHDRGLSAEPSHRPVRPFDAVPLDLQTLDVRDEPIELHGVHEIVRDGPPPLLERLLLRLAVKRIVELDGVEVPRVVLEPLPRRAVARRTMAATSSARRARCGARSGSSFSGRASTRTSPPRRTCASTPSSTAFSRTRRPTDSWPAAIARRSRSSRSCSASRGTSTSP